MAQERLVTKEEHESLWKKSTAAKVGAAMVVVGAFFSAPVAAFGLGVVAGSAAWHAEKNPFREKK